MFGTAVKPCPTMTPDIFHNNIMQLPHALAHYEAMPVLQHYDGVGRFVYCLNEILVEHKLCAVKLCQKDHNSLKLIKIGIRRRPSAWPAAIRNFSIKS